MRSFLLLICGAVAILALLYWQFVGISPPRITAPPIKAVTPPVATPTTDAANETDRIILSLFNPDAAEISDFSAEKRLHDRYHTVYISLYLLKGCGDDVDDYHRTLSELFSRDWSNLGTAYASADNVHKTLGDILKQASGSYSLLYQNTPCEKRNLPAIRRYFNALD